MIGETLKALRKREGVTAKAIAETLDILPDTYRSYETGRREPNLETLKAIADHFEVSTDYLLGRNVPPPEYLTKSEKDLEACILEKYKQLPESYRKKFLQGVIEAVEIQKREQVTQEMVTEEKTIQEAANDTEQISKEMQVEVTTVQEVSTVENAAEQNPVEAVAEADEAQQVDVVQEEITQSTAQDQDSPKEEQSESYRVIARNPIIPKNLVARNDENSKATLERLKEAYEAVTDIDEDYFN